MHHEFKDSVAFNLNCLRAQSTLPHRNFLFSMASMSGAHTVHADLVRGTIAEVKQLTVDRLKRVLKYEGLQVSGLKSELQTRLIARTYL